MKTAGSLPLPTGIKFAALLCLLFTGIARAHEPGRSYLSLTLDSGRLTGHWNIPLRDLPGVVPLSLDANGAITPDQLAAHYPEITAYAISHLQILLDGRAVELQLLSPKPSVEVLSDGAYVQLDFMAEHFPPPQTLELKYQLFFETNSLHRGLLRLEAGGKVHVAAFSPEHPAQQFSLALPASDRQFFSFVREGVWHIWTGYDHILFLLALLLPSVLQRENGQWRGVGALRPACLNVLKIVTAFTLAHSLTLSLATLRVVQLPLRFTESVIALSVVLAAANNLWPVIRLRGWMVAFVFGLIHGFGFATALADLGLTHGSLWLTLIGFNLGVEIGQLAIVAVFLPAAFAVRRTWLYQAPVLRLGSACIILVAGAWCAERVLDLRLMPF